MDESVRRVKKKGGPTPPRPRVRTVEGVPGTVEPGFKDRPLVEGAVPAEVHELFESIGAKHETLRRFTMGPCNILVGRERAGKNGELLWHMTISTPSRHPTWDEIKTARYRLLPLDLVFAMLLPPPQFYVNVPQQDHVMQLWEVHDEREQWTTS